MTDALAQNSPSAALGQFVVTTAENDLPEELTRSVKAAIDHVLSTAILGSASEPAKIARAAFLAESMTQQATVLGASQRSPAAIAAFCNATSAYVGGARDSVTVVVMAVLAASELEQASLDQLTLGVTLGLEVVARVQAALGASHLELGFDPMGTAGRIGAVAGAASVAGLTATQLRAGFGFGATTAAGLDNGGAVYPSAFVAGLAASDALEAVLFAASGMTGPPAPLEGRRGLLALESRSANAALLIDRIGEAWSAWDLLSGPVALDWRFVDLAGLLDR